MKFIEHRGSLDESMSTLVELPATKADLYNHIVKSWGILSNHMGDINNLKITPYGFDNRIGWNSHIVTLETGGVVGFTNSPVIG